MDISLVWYIAALDDDPINDDVLVRTACKQNNSEIFKTGKIPAFLREIDERGVIDILAPALCAAFTS